MRAKFLAILLVLFSTWPFFAIADPLPPFDPGDIKIEPFPTPSKPHSPGAGYENEVKGLLYDGVLTITFEEPEGMATVVLRENGTTIIYRGLHDTAFPISISVPDTFSPVQIWISTEENNQYEGWIY